MTLSAGALPGPRWGSLRRSPRPPGHPFPFAVDAFGVEAPCLTSKFQGVAAPLNGNIRFTRIEVLFCAL